MARYILASPVHDGTQYWCIEDKKVDLELVYIHQSVPNAEKIIKGIFEALEGSEGGSGGE